MDEVRDTLSLTDDLRDAIRIEICTIPLYLFAMFSIKPDTDKIQARAKISTVVHQEMLHLALAGNLSTAAGKAPILYNKEYFPTYGGPNDTILKSKIPLILDRCKKDGLKAFVMIEAPWAPGPPALEFLDTVPKEDSIGAFYKRLAGDIKRGSNGFNQNKDMQFSEDSGFDATVTVTDKATAEKALGIIVDQGEGSVGVADAHYQMFLNLYHNREQWSCWNVNRNPKQTDYSAQPLIKELNSAFNAAYCYLLLIISKVWHTNNAVVRRKLFGTNHSIMVNVLSALGNLLVSLPFTGGTDAEPKHGAPTFEKYPTGNSVDIAAAEIDNKAKEFQKAVRTHIDAAKKNTQEEEVKKLLDAVLLSIGRASWP